MDVIKKNAALLDKIILHDFLKNHKIKLYEINNIIYDIFKKKCTYTFLTNGDITIKGKKIGNIDQIQVNKKTAMNAKKLVIDLYKEYVKSSKAIYNSNVYIYPTKKYTIQNIFKLQCKLEKITLNITSGLYFYKENESFVNFAANSIGGGVFGRGWVQEEIAMASSNILPIIHVYNTNKRKLPGCSNMNLSELNKRPSIIYGRMFIHINNNIYGGHNLNTTIKNKTDLQKNMKTIKPVNIYWICMAAPKRYKQFINKPYRIKESVHIYGLAFRGFYSIALLLKSKGLPIIINTGNWGSGAFNQNINVMYILQRLAINSVATITGYPIIYNHSGFSSKIQGILTSIAEPKFKELIKKSNDINTFLKELENLTSTDNDWNKKY